MPQVIGALVISAVTDVSVSAAATASFTVAGVTVTYASVVGATIIAASSLALSAALQPGVPKQDGQVTLQQPVPFRRRSYGRVKLAGYFVFWNSINGNFYQIVVLGSQEWDAIEEYWLGDRRVTRDGSGWVTAVNYPPGALTTQFNPRGALVVQILSQLGGAGKTNYAPVTAAFPSSWPATCIGRGCPDVMLLQKGVKSQDFGTVYPGGSQPIRVVARAEKNIYDPRDLTTAWRDNAILVIRDYLTNADGWRLDPTFLDTGLAAPITAASIAIADQDVPLSSGGSEKRYRIWGFYDFQEEPRSVLARMLAACGGWLQPQTDGTIAIRAGAWVAPDVTIKDEHILGFDVQHFVGEFDAVNQVRATFNYQQNDFQDTESTPWDNDADIARRGYIKSTTIDARYCPSFTQTRRIQKIAKEEVSPDFSITLTTNAFGLAARNRRFINLDMSKTLGIVGTFRLTSFVANLQTGVCTIGLASFQASAYDWNPSTDEGPAPPISPDDANTSAIEVPTNLTINVETKSVNGGSDGTIAVITVDPPADRNDLIAKFEIQVAGESSWTTIPTGTDSYSAQTGFIPDGTYNFRASFLTASAVQSGYIEVDNVVVTAASSAPTPPTAIAVTSPSGGHATVTFTAPNSTKFYAARVWRNTSATFGTAVDVSGQIFGSPNQGLSFADAPGAGLFYYWATAENSGTPPAASAPDGPVSITV